MRILNRVQITAKAKDVFQRYPKANKIAITSDGQAFIVDVSENAVKNHATRNRHKKELEIFRFNRDAVMAETPASRDADSKGNKTKKTSTPSKPKTVEEQMAAIKDAKTIEAVEVVLNEEKAGGKRVTVIKAAQDKLELLKPPVFENSNID
jgi:hypothetical protein